MVGEVMGAVAWTLELMQVPPPPCFSEVKEYIFCLVWSQGSCKFFP